MNGLLEAGETPAVPVKRLNLCSSEAFQCAHDQALEGSLVQAAAGLAFKQGDGVGEDGCDDGEAFADGFG
jgi:hypothetical protein